jgi:benzoate-CoA ligase family protein
MTPYNACTDLLGGAGRDRVAVRSRARAVTYGELSSEVAAVAGGLASLGVRPEERVAMVMLDSIEFYDVFLGAMRIGAVPAPVNPLLPGRDLGGIVAAGRARVLLVSEERASEIAAISAAAPELQEVVVVGSPQWEKLATSAPVGAYPTWEDSPGFWLCTSGSTGTPKLAMHRHIDLRRTAETYAADVLRLGEDDRCFSVGPMFHAYGLGNSLTFPFTAGASAIVEPTRPPTPALVASLVAEFEPTVLFCVPTFYAALLASDLPAETFASVRMGVSAAEPLPADLWVRFRDRFGVEILDGIGSTEMTHIFISNRAGSVRPGTSGQPVPGYHVELLDESGTPVPDGTPGQLHVGGDTMATGYWCATEATRSVFHGARMRTGDMYVRSDDGYYTYLGRSDDMLRVGGEWVSPAEVEAVLIGDETVLEAAVVGERDDLGVQRPIAFVVARPGASIDVGALDARCRSSLAGFKRPRAYSVLDALPKTATGKVQRFKLRRD